MPGESGPTNRPSRNWDKAAAFAAVAALSPIVLLVLERGILARARALLSDTNAAAIRPPVSWFVVHVDVVAWAWVIFFVVLAFVFLRDTGSEEEALAVSEAFDDYPETEPRPEVATAGPRIAAPRAAAEPSAGSRDSVPVVPNMPQALAWLKKGNELYALGHVEQAIANFDSAIRLNPRLAGAWAGKGLASNALGQYQEAIRCYDESLRLDPRDPAVWHDKGNTLCAIGRLEGALNCFNETLVLDPRDARAWNNKGICLASLGRPEEALPCCSKATELDPSFAVAWHARAVIEERLGLLPQAIATYKRFVTLAPEGEAVVERVRRHVSALEAAPKTEA
ncbi:tetratricopeptide repeat protein [candidate division WOR-3 bacterium]|uniref:Tetratricopeptide repeat protein n=1 Tax=candidate division WOR-3 bacterium TaxID=2052148 RepID=A0A938BSB5_UNCW3|nr:tetratricopeptide repeat protein [candidate division WOR-3 bacterium]